jgi:quercetin dioxygenase-like cupin family protein
MSSMHKRTSGAATRALAVIALFAGTGMLHAADYCCLCQGEAGGKTISASNRMMAVGQCTVGCGTYTNVSSGKCAEPPPAATPTPSSATPAPPAATQAPPAATQAPAKPTTATTTPAAPPAPAPAPSPPNRFAAVAAAARVLADDGRIRVIDFRPTAGTSVPMHAHPTTVVYLVEGGATRFTLTDGSTVERSSRAGEVLINAPVTHAQLHTTPSHAILIEIDDAAKFESPAAQTDLMSAAPGHVRLLNENDRVRVYDYAAKKGDAVSMHSHSTHVVYLIKAGKTQFIFPDGRAPAPAQLEDGAALINPPVTHAQVHLEDVHAIIVELKR